MRITGIGPVRSVMLSRAQVAIVVTDLGTTEDGDTLRVKPEFALIVETQTSEIRIRPIVEQALRQLAESTYKTPTVRRTQVNGVEFIEWRNEEASRQIVAAIIGSLVVVGNSEASVQRCLDSAGRRSPSLKEDPNLHRLRRELTGNQSLTFGYVPEAKSAQLLSFVVPLILGRAPGDAGFQKLVSTAAAKLFGSVAWSSQAFRNGIEDRYLISLRPSVLKKLQSTFKPNPDNTQKRILPEDTHSVTYYRLENPLAAWEGLRTTVAANTDALSAVVFSSLLKSALLSYGLAEPEAFLQTVTGDIVTLRLDANGDQTLLVAGVKNREALRALVLKNMKPEANQNSNGAEFFVNEEGDIAAAMINDVVIMGTAVAVRQYSETLIRQGATQNPEYLHRLNGFLPFEGSSLVLTYTDDRDRVRRFFEALKTAGGAPQNDPLYSESLMQKLPYAVTETRLVDQGFERITRSPLGQFSTFLPLFIPEPRGPASVSPSR